MRKIVKQYVKAVGDNSKVFAGLCLPALKTKSHGRGISKAIKVVFKGGAGGIAFFDYNALSDRMLKEVKDFGGK